MRARLDQFEEKLDSMTPADEREETRLAWARRRLARGGPTSTSRSVSRSPAAASS